MNVLAIRGAREQVSSLGRVEYVHEVVLPHHLAKRLRDTIRWQVKHTPWQAYSFEEGEELYEPLRQIAYMVGLDENSRGVRFVRILGEKYKRPIIDKLMIGFARRGFGCDSCKKFFVIFFARGL